MTGRGRGFRLHRSSNPEVTIGLTIGTSSPALDPSSDAPFYVTVKARISSTPQPQSPVTLATHYNPFGSLHMRSFNNIKCVAPPASAKTGKHIEIWPRSWPNFNTGVRNMRERYSFVTVPSRLSSADSEENSSYVEVKHQVPRDAILAAGLQNGETYRVSLTDRGLGTMWYMFGTLEDVEGMKLGAWKEDKEESDETPEEDLDDWEKEERKGPWFRGENAYKLVLFIEKGEVDFKVA